MDEKEDTAKLCHGRTAFRTTSSVAMLLSWIVADEDQKSSQNEDDVICIEDDEDADSEDVIDVVNCEEDEEINVEDTSDHEKENQEFLSTTDVSSAEPPSSRPFEHKCEQCFQTFEEERGLYEHLLSEHDDDDDFETYECRICPKICRTKIDLDKHMRSHQVKKMYKCHICNKRWKTRMWSFRLHMKTVHNSIKIKNKSDSKIRWSHTCSVCGLHFYCLKSLNKHVRQHGEEKMSELGEIVKEAGAQESVSKEAEPPEESAKEEPSVFSSANPRPGMKGMLYECDLCGKTVKSLWRLRDHRRRHTGTDLYRCEACNIGFRHLGDWCEHNKIHYTCQHCELRFSYQSVLDKHVRTVHTKEKQICDICGKGVCNVRVHKATAHEPRPNQFMCPTCFKWVKTEKDIEYHKLFHDNNGSCPECGRKFDTLYLFKLHLQNHDINSHELMQHEKPYICDVCSKGYRFPRELREHQVAVHEKERNYQCEHCGKTYRYAANVRKHKLATGCGRSDNARRSVRTRNHRCEHCGKLFSFELNMRKHQQKTGCGQEGDGRPKYNQCEHCWRVFRFPSFVRRHQAAGCGQNSNSLNSKTKKPPQKKEKPKKMLARKQAVTRYQCETCELSFKCRKEWVEHNKAHYACQHCELRFSSQSYLDRHIRTVHEKERSICDICGKQVFNVCDHIARVHEPKPDQLQCPTCLRWVKTEKDIEFHNLFHDNKGICPVCSKKLDSQSLFKFHVQNHDISSHELMQREKPYVCDVCSKSYRFPRELREHQAAVHERARNFKCEHCGKAYYYKANVRFHKLRTGCGRNDGKTKGPSPEKKKSKK